MSMNENYRILGVSETATDQEVDAASMDLKQKYSKDRFLEGEAGNEAAKILTKLENAYAEILSERQSSSDCGCNDGSVYGEIERLIKEGKYDDAQRVLDDVSDRSAEWHYLQSVLFYKKNWINESKKQLEIAVEMETDNQKYKTANDKMQEKINFNRNQFHSGNANYSTNGGHGERQMGGTDCGPIAECCAMNLLLNCLCNGCCR